MYLPDSSVLLVNIVVVVVLVVVDKVAAEVDEVTSDNKVLVLVTLSFDKEDLTFVEVDVSSAMVKPTNDNINYYQLHLSLNQILLEEMPFIYPFFML